ncbi:hypothetical protein CHUAL_005454 [Chamberlinius hualienensis]
MMGEIFDKFNFIYDNHVGTLLEGVRRHYEGETYADLMIVCDGGEVLKAHRWMIDIFAPQLLANCEENTVKLHVEDNIMRLIFEFFYKGNFEACVSDFTKLRKAANSLSLDYLSTALDAAQSLDASSEFRNENETADGVENLNVNHLADEKPNETSTNERIEAIIETLDEVVKIEGNGENKNETDPELCTTIPIEDDIDGCEKISVAEMVVDYKKPEGVKTNFRCNNNNAKMVSLLKSSQSSKRTKTEENASLNVEKRSLPKTGTIQIRKNASGVQISRKSGAIQLRKKRNGTVEVISECGDTVEIRRKGGAVQIANKGGKAIQINKILNKDVKIINKRVMDTDDEIWRNIVACGASVRCVHCDFIAVKKEDFDTHVSTEHSDVSVIDGQIKCRCTLCDFVAAHEHFLCRHWKEKHRPMLQSKRSLGNHAKVDRHLKGTFSCSECDYVTTLKKLLIRHQAYKHGDGRPFPCDQCNYVGKTRYCLKIHKEKHKPKTLECDICGKKLAASELLLNKHKKRHVDRFFPCQICAYRFREKGNLKRHLLRQHGVSSSRKSKLTLNNDEENCPLCDVVVLNRTYLIHHLTGVHKVDEQLNAIHPSISCPKCEFTCHLESQLKIHKVTVHKENSKSVQTKFSCQVCGNSYSSKAHVNRHIEQVHNPNGINVTCQLCGYSSKSKDYLLQHVKRMHNKTQ